MKTGLKTNSKTIPKTNTKVAAKAKTKTKPRTKAKPKVAEKKPLSEAEKLCSNVNGGIKDQAITLTNAVLAMQEKIEQQIPIYKQMPLAQQVKVGTGEKMLRQNPATQEFRATVRDYAMALNSLKEILDTKEKTSPTISPVDDLRKRFKVG